MTATAAGISDETFQRREAMKTVFGIAAAVVLLAAGCSTTEQVR